nr:hypothetical protein Q903MT_gene3298 [Picea sitchensis]
MFYLQVQGPLDSRSIHVSYRCNITFLFLFYYAIMYFVMGDAVGAFQSLNRVLFLASPLGYLSLYWSYSCCVYF